NRVFAVACGAVEYAQDAFRKRTGMSFSAAVASEPVNFDRIARMVIRLRQVMVGYLGNEREVIAHVETLITDRKAGNMDWEASGSIRLKSCLELQRRQEFFDILSACGEELTEAGSRHDPRAMELYYSISVMLLQFINENHLNEKITFRIGLYKLTKVDEHASWMEAYQYLSDVSEAVFGLLGDNEKSLSGKALKRVCDYIDHHLSGDLTLPRLADEGGFNASYLSRLFKQVYGITITDYIYQKRMKLAMELLASTNQKIQDIVEQTGYLSAHSFARAFRSYAGISPSEYREQAKK
ncbi:MAG: AraC family transcriptional regulator, partial [Lachnospiraceae bacterium]|nr:AraC family transcriptional regulator [Lachnospiraceae bacterium]